MCLILLYREPKTLLWDQTVRILFQCLLIKIILRTKLLFTKREIHFPGRKSKFCQGATYLKSSLSRIHELLRNTLNNYLHLLKTHAIFYKRWAKFCSRKFNSTIQYQICPICPLKLNILWFLCINNRNEIWYALVNNLSTDTRYIHW